MEEKYLFIDPQDEYEFKRRELFRKTCRRVFWCLVALALIIACGPAFAEERDHRVDALVVFSAAGHKTPVGGVGVYQRPYGKRIGRVETLGDGSTVLRGAYGRVVAKTEPRLSSSAPIRVTVRTKK